MIAQRWFEDPTLGQLLKKVSYPTVSFIAKATKERDCVSYSLLIQNTYGVGLHLISSTQGSFLSKATIGLVY